MNSLAQYSAQQISVTADYKLDLGISHNDALPDNIQQLIQKKLSDAEHRLASLKATINSTVDHPNLEYSDLARHIKSYRTAIAPHRKLPNDVLLEIFLYLTPSHITTPLHTSGSYAKPYDLMHVCSKWRQLVFRLWHDIFVLYKSIEDLERNAVFIKDVILHSVGLPISLTMRVVKEFSPSEDLMPAVKEAVADLIIEVAESLNNLTWVGDPYILFDFLKIRPGLDRLVEFKLLENVSLELGDCDFIWPHYSRVPIYVFEKAHNLHTFTTTGAIWDHRHSLPPSIATSLLNLPWNQITRLYFTSKHRIRCGEFLRLLYQCASLSEFRGRIYSNRFLETELDELPSLSEVPVVPSLNLLWIDCGVQYTRLFPRLNLPNLTSLQLRDDFKSLCRSQEWNSILLQFFMRSNHLTHLTFWPVRHYGWHNMLYTYLRELPLLVNLSLWCEEPLLKTTLEAIGRGELVPMLETLRVEDTGDSFEPLWNMLERRCMSGNTRGFTCIQNVVITSTNEEDLVDLQSESLERVKWLKAQGLCIDFELDFTSLELIEYVDET